MKSLIEKLQSMNPDELIRLSLNGKVIDYTTPRHLLERLKDVPADVDITWTL